MNKNKSVKIPSVKPPGNKYPGSPDLSPKKDNPINPKKDELGSIKNNDKIKD